MNKFSTILALTAALAAVGCMRHVSRDISDGGVAGAVIFPEISRIVLKEGTFPNVDDLRLVGSGVTKDQLYQLLGRPHFREGFAGVREWDYLFHFRKGETVTTCQYKVIFDSEYRARSFHWLPQDCAAVLDRPAPPVAAAPVPVQRTRNFTVEGDGLFAFAKWGLNDLSGGGRARLGEVAVQLKAADDVRYVEVLAHTDRIGSDAANLALSQRRADTIRNYLIGQGIAAGMIRATGLGEHQPVVECPAGGDRRAEVECLAPNRRVEIRAAAGRGE